MNVPPPLAWVPHFCDSTGRALDLKLAYEIRSAGTPLMYVVHIRWPEPIEPKFYMSVWNLFQIWAWKNETIPQSSPLHAPFSMSITVAVKRRLGLPREDHPLS
jgi:hypothetical protein